MQSSPPRLLLVLLGATVALGLGASAARPAGADTVSISMLAFTNEQPGLAVLIPNFERVYPSISVNVTQSRVPRRSIRSRRPSSPRAMPPTCSRSIRPAARRSPSACSRRTATSPRCSGSPGQSGPFRSCSRPTSGVRGCSRSRPRFRLSASSATTTCSRSSDSLCRRPSRRCSFCARRRRPTERWRWSGVATQTRSTAWSSRWPSRPCTGRTSTGRPSSRPARSRSTARPGGTRPCRNMPT